MHGIEFAFKRIEIRAAGAHTSGDQMQTWVSGMISRIESDATRIAQLEAERSTCTTCLHVRLFENMSTPCPHCIIEELKAKLEVLGDESMAGMLPGERPVLLFVGFHDDNVVETCGEQPHNPTDVAYVPLPQLNDAIAATDVLKESRRLGIARIADLEAKLAEAERVITMLRGYRERSAG